MFNYKNFKFKCSDFKNMYISISHQNFKPVKVMLKKTKKKKRINLQFYLNMSNKLTVKVMLTIKMDKTRVLLEKFKLSTYNGILLQKVILRI